MKSIISISVIIPVYNISQYLPSFISSLIKQEAEWLEFIFIDDGSDDSSSSILENYKGNLNFRIIRQCNQGVAAARNRGIEAARGDYLCFIDPDDTISVSYFAAFHSVIAKSHADFILCNWGSRNYDEIQLHLLQNVDNPLKVPTDYMFMQMLQGEKMLTGSLWGKMFSKHLFENNTFPLKHSNSDYIPCFKAIGNAQTTAYCYAATYYYTTSRSNSLQHTQSSKDLSYLVSTRKELLRFTSSRYPDLYHLAELDYYKAILQVCDQALRSRDISNKKAFIDHFRKLLQKAGLRFMCSFFSSKEIIKYLLIVYLGYFPFHFSKNIYSCVKRIGITLKSA